MKILNYDLKTPKFKWVLRDLETKLFLTWYFLTKILLKGYASIRSKNLNTDV
jgi:hypothetical protein